MVYGKSRMTTGPSCPGGKQFVLWVLVALCAGGCGSAGLDMPGLLGRNDRAEAVLEPGPEPGPAPLPEVSSPSAAPAPPSAPAPPVAGPVSNGHRASSVRAGYGFEFEDGDHCRASIRTAGPALSADVDFRSTRSHVTGSDWDWHPVEIGVGWEWYEEDDYDGGLADHINSDSIASDVDSLILGVGRGFGEPFSGALKYVSYDSREVRQIDRELYGIEAGTPILLADEVKSETYDIEYRSYGVDLEARGLTLSCAIMKEKQSLRELSTGANYAPGPTPFTVDYDGAGEKTSYEVALGYGGAGGAAEGFYGRGSFKNSPYEPIQTMGASLTKHFGERGAARIDAIRTWRDGNSWGPSVSFEEYGWWNLGVKERGGVGFRFMLTEREIALGVPIVFSRGGFDSESAAQILEWLCRRSRYNTKEDGLAPDQKDFLLWDGWGETATRARGLLLFLELGFDTEDEEGESYLDLWLAFPVSRKVACSSYWREGDFSRIVKVGFEVTPSPSTTVSLLYEIDRDDSTAVRPEWLTLSGTYSF